MDAAKLVSDLLAAIVKNKIESNSFEQSKKYIRSMMKNLQKQKRLNGILFMGKIFQRQFSINYLCFIALF